MNRILPCPHCGGSACLNSNYSYKSRSYFVYVRCDICGAQAKSYSSETAPASEQWDNVPCADAINAWNMRTSSRRASGCNTEDNEDEI